MGKWRTWFEASLPLYKGEMWQFGEIYEFGPPATADQIAGAERVMGFAFPDDLRELLAEFNGIWYTTEGDRKHGYERSQLYLDTEEMSVEAPRMLRESSNELPPQEDLNKIAIVCQINGYGEFYALCLDDFAKHRKGAIVRLDHEVGELEPCYPSLEDFVRKGPVEEDEE